MNGHHDWDFNTDGNCDRYGTLYRFQSMSAAFISIPIAACLALPPTVLAIAGVAGVVFEAARCSVRRGPASDQQLGKARRR